MSAAAVPNPSTRREVLYEGVAYQRLGEVVNSVLLMTYEWGYLYGRLASRQGEPNSPGLSKIPTEKLCLGIPNDGHN